MKRLQVAAVAGVLALVSLGAVQSQNPSTPPATAGWRTVADKTLCAALKGDVLVGSADGRSFAVALRAVDLKGVMMRPVKADGRPLMLTFTQGAQAANAELDSVALGALATSSELSLEWAGTKYDVAGLADALPAVQTCAARLDAERVAAVEAKAKADAKQAKSRALLNSLMSGGSGGSGGNSVGQGGGSLGRDPQGVRGGVTCMKESEQSAGMNTHCIYDCIGREVVQTVGPGRLCPFTIKN